MDITDVAMMILLAFLAHVVNCIAFGDVSAGYLASAFVVLLYIAYWLRGVDHSLRRLLELLTGQEEIRPGLKAVITQLQATLRDIAEEDPCQPH